MSFFYSSISVCNVRMLRRHKPLQYEHMVASDSETESEDLSTVFSAQPQNRKGNGKETSSKSMSAYKENPDMVMKRADMYQEYMKQMKIPTVRGSVIPFNTWQGLAKSMKQLYGQPLHYLTNVQLKQWDKSRIGTEDEDQPMDNIIHPCKAEATIWLIEEIHRRTTSHHHLAKLWLADPMYYAFLDPDVPKSG